MHWTEVDFTCLAKAWVTASVQTTGRTNGFTFYQKVNIAFKRDPECPTRRSSGSTKSQWYTLNAQCVVCKGIVAQERFRNSNGKTEEDRENDAHKIYQGLNGDGSLYEGGSRPIGQKLYRKNLTAQKALDGVAASGSGIQTMLDKLWLEKIQAKEEKERRAEAMQYWQAKIDFEQANEDRKIMEKDLSTLSGHQL
ncbi:hypothetical protein GIB67_022675 [Kingdonia uniflora]|uniref:No apical meristem-associated C-terminal domain-containing protein n=1 Tax=Kingdonia uniflora TaxID=39325 RepID=A0A7J7P8L0_9MAGN|nr:hypothetical protein GIB67_022675 [Kingdonia uniflora]